MQIDNSKICVYIVVKHIFDVVGGTYMRILFFSYPVMYVLLSEQSCIKIISNLCYMCGAISQATKIVINGIA